MTERKPLRKINDDSWIAGVCGGIAYAYGLPVTFVRIFFFLFVFILTNSYTYYIGQALFLFYVLFWAFGPDWYSDPKDYDRRTS